MATIKQYRAFFMLLTILAVVQAYCGSGCASCVDDICQVCESGYYKVGVMCSSCQSGCAVCSSNTACSQCKDGYFMNSSRCENCKYGCKICEDSISCIQCASEHYPINDSNGEISECANCIEHCSECTGPTGCIKCSPIYKYEGEKCVLNILAIILGVTISLVTYICCNAIWIAIWCCKCLESASEVRISRYIPDINSNRSTHAPRIAMQEPSHEDHLPHHLPPPLPPAKTAKQYNQQPQQWGVNQPYTSLPPFVQQPIPMVPGQGEPYEYQPVKI